jgi:hypothetical protein
MHLVKHARMLQKKDSANIEDTEAEAEGLRIQEAT